MHQAVARMGTEDERPMLKKMRRSELFHYAQAKKIEVHPDDPAEDMRRRLIECGFDGTDAVETIRNLMAVQEARKEIEREAKEEAKRITMNEVKEKISDPMKQTATDSVGFAVLKKPDGTETLLVQSGAKVFERRDVGEIDAMTMPQLRKAIKAAGLKQSPKDTAGILRARLRGQDTS